MSQKINLDKSLGEFVAQYPQSRELFNTFDLDYCCGGEKKISVAAKEKNIDLNEFESLLQKIVERIPDTEKYKSWTNESLINIVENIEKVHHSLAWQKLDSIEILLNKLIQVHGEKHGDFIFHLKSIFIDFKQKLEKHLHTEENIVFAYVRKSDASSVAEEEKFVKVFGLNKKSIEELQQEHEEAGEFLHQIKSFTSNYGLPDYACASFAKLYEDLETLEDDLHAHIHLENTVLFPKLIKSLDL